MDGTRDRPPGKSAENWSRKDGIRAGAVSGPWRSAPRADDAPAPVRPNAKPAPAAARPVVPKARAETAPPAPGKTHSPAGHAHVDSPFRASHRQGPKRRVLATASWIGFGVVVAVGSIIAAFVFRPDQPINAPQIDSPQVALAPVAPAPETAGQSVSRESISLGDRGNFVDIPSQTEAPSAQVPVAAEEPAPAAAAETAAPPAVDPGLAGVSSVRLRVGPDFPADRQAAIVKALDDAGVPSVKVEQLPFKIATSRVGYYRGADMAAAEALGKLITPVVGDGASVGVRDYGKLLADADPGRLDLWIGD